MTPQERKALGDMLMAGPLPPSVGERLKMAQGKPPEASQGGTTLGQILARIFPSYSATAMDVGDNASGAAGGVIRSYADGVRGITSLPGMAMNMTTGSDVSTAVDPLPEDMRAEMERAGQIAPEAATAGYATGLAGQLAPGLPARAMGAIAEAPVRAAGAIAKAAPRAAAGGAMLGAPSAVADGEMATTPLDGQIRDLQGQIAKLEGRRTDLEGRLGKLPKGIDLEGIKQLWSEFQAVRRKDPERAAAIQEEIKRAQSTAGVNADGRYGDITQNAIERYNQGIEGQSEQERQRLQTELQSLGLDDLRTRLTQLQGEQSTMLKDAGERKNAERAGKNAGFTFETPLGPLTIDPNTMNVLSAALFGTLGYATASKANSASASIASKQASQVDDLAQSLKANAGENFGRSQSTPGARQSLDDMFADVSGRSMAAEDAKKRLDRLDGVGAFLQRQAPQATAMGAAGGLIAGTSAYKGHVTEQADQLLEQYTAETDPVKKDELLAQYKAARARGNLAEALNYGEIVGTMVGTGKGLVGKPIVAPSAQLKGETAGIINTEVGATRRAKETEARLRSERADAEKAQAAKDDPSLLSIIKGAVAERIQGRPGTGAASANTPPTPPAGAGAGPLPAANNQPSPQNAQTPAPAPGPAAGASPPAQPQPVPPPLNKYEPLHTIIAGRPAVSEVLDGYRPDAFSPMQDGTFPITNQLHGRVTGKIAANTGSIVDQPDVAARTQGTLQAIAGLDKLLQAGGRRVTNPAIRQQVLDMVTGKPGLLSIAGAGGLSQMDPNMLAEILNDPRAFNNAETY